VDLEMKMTNQRGVDTTFAEATVSLPHGRCSAAASVPPEIARQTPRMYQRHRNSTSPGAPRRPLPERGLSP
jgi:hypothetical protein